LSTRGVLVEACRAAGITKQGAYQYRARHPDFAAAWEEAVEEAAGRAEAELYRRGVYGWERPVYFGGRQVGAERLYSDQCLIAFLRARSPAYRRRAAALERRAPPGRPVATRTEAEEDAARAAHREAVDLVIDSILTERRLRAAAAPAAGRPDAGGGRAADGPAPPAVPAPAAGVAPPDPHGRPCPRCVGAGRALYCPICRGSGRLG
jgi:hypothetical protein